MLTLRRQATQTWDASRRPARRPAGTGIAAAGRPRGRAARPRSGRLLAAVSLGRGARFVRLGAQAAGALGERLAARLVGAQLPARLGRRGLRLPQLGRRARALLRVVGDWIRKLPTGTHMSRMSTLWSRPAL